MCYQLIDPGSEWRLHPQWYEHNAMRDLLASPMSVVPADTLYRCLDKLVAHNRSFDQILLFQPSPYVPDSIERVFRTFKSINYILSLYFRSVMLSSGSMLRLHTGIKRVGG